MKVDDAGWVGADSSSPLGSCGHQPPCPHASASDRDAARVVKAQPEQGWSLLCNGVLTFDDTGELLPDRTVVPPRRPGYCHPTRTKGSGTLRVGSAT